MIRALIALALLAGLPAGLAALELPAGARQITERDSALDSYDLPTAPADAAGLPARRFEGRVLRRVWRLDSGAATTLQLLAPMRAELVAEGYDIVFECADRGCGGFDFRFRTEVVPAPDMHVNLRDFRFLSATRGPEEALSLLVSRSRATSHIQIITVNITSLHDVSRTWLSEHSADVILVQEHRMIYKSKFGKYRLMP